VFRNDSTTETERVIMRTLLVALVVLFVGTAAQAQAPPASGPADLMPAPAEVVWQAGHLVLNGAVGSSGPADPRVEAARDRARARLSALGLRPPSRRPGQATLVLRWQNPGLPVQAVGEDESYTLTVRPRQAGLEAATPLGIVGG